MENVTVAYTYDADGLRTSKTVTYDTIGNILTFGKLKSYTWEQGWELATLTQGTDFGITKQPEDFVGRIGDEITFSVPALGTDLTYQWQMSTNGGSSWGYSTAGGYKTASMAVTMTEKIPATCTAARSRMGKEM